MVQRIVRRLTRWRMLPLALMTLSGCLSFELTASVSPAGRLVGTTSLNAPVWLAKRWYGDRAQKPNVTIPMLERMEIRYQSFGSGAWIDLATIEQFRTPFLSFRYRVEKDRWQLWGMLKLAPETMKLLEKELNRRAGQIPRVHADRAPKLAAAMLRQAKFKVMLRTVWPVSETSGEKIEERLVMWKTTFDELQKNDGKAFLTVEGKLTPWRSFVAWVDGILPAGEID